MLLQMRWIAWTLLWPLAFPLLSQAATEAEIEASRLKGIEYIKSQQDTDGSWPYPSYTTGVTALCTLALIENGVPLNDSVVDKGYRYVRRQADSLENTYEISLSILLMARVGNRLDRNTIRTLGGRLLSGQNEEGGWSYKCPKSDGSVLSNIRKIERRPGGGDNSCTQFGVLGLWVASRFGVPIDEAMNSVATRFLGTQNEDGGWSYKPSTPEMPAASGNSMTCAGLFSLTVARATKIRAAQRSSTEVRAETRGEKETLLADPNYAKGFAQVGRYAKGIGPGSAKYFLWSVERLGVLLGLEKLGDANWFATGADALVKTQRPEGYWSEGKEQLSDAAFAILFLRKANLGSDISRLLEGEPDQQFCIVRSDGLTRYDTFAEAHAAAQAGDVIRVDGNGPFKFSHDVFDKDLTVQAGHGYDPIFEFEIGLNKQGLRYRPDRDVEAQHMLTVTAGTLTLEGLRVQFDPPISSQPLPWKAVLVNGGNLRLLNCAFSESNRRGMTSVVLQGPGSVYARNCQFVGGRAAIEVIAAGMPQMVTLENSLLFAPIAASVIPSPDKAKADVSWRLFQCVVQADEAFAAPKVDGQIAIESMRTLYKCESLAMSLLPSTSSTEGRSWKGSQNVYNVRNWVGSYGKARAGVNSPSTFAKLWGDGDQSGTAQTIAFIASRRNGAFAHGVNVQDWDLGEKSELAISSTRYGLAVANVGPGTAFSRYRDDIRYNAWMRGESEPELLADVAVE